MKTVRIRSGISLAADIAGILAFVGLTATGFTALLEKSRSHSWDTVAYIFLAFVVMPLLGYVILKRLSTYREEQKLHRHLYDKEFTLSSAQLRSKLVSDEMLSDMHQKLMKHVHDWDPDALVDSLRMNESIDANKEYLVTLGAGVYSSWRKKRGYIGIRMDSKRRSHNFISSLNDTHATKPPKHTLVTPFFKSHPNWRDEIIRLYGPIEFSRKRSIHAIVEQDESHKLPQISVLDDTERLDKEDEIADSYHSTK
jgi:phosphate/sulfate permease